jgi:hypothetical protein
MQRVMLAVMLVSGFGINGYAQTKRIIETKFFTAIVYEPTSVSLQATTAGQPNIEHFTEYRNGLLQRSNGQTINARLSSLFKIPPDTRISPDAEMVFPADRRLTLAFSITSEDIFLLESKSSGNGTVVRVFHTDIRSLSLLAAAIGPTTNDLQAIPNDQVESDFREILLSWQRFLERRRER